MTNKTLKLCFLTLVTCFLSSHQVMARSQFLPEATNNDFGNTGHFSGSDRSDYQHCINLGYTKTVTSCGAGYAVDIKDRCPFSLSSPLYKKCYSYQELCINKGYTLSCPAGKEPNPDQSCPYDSVYTKCRCKQCLGYNLDSQTGCSYGYDQCDNGCGTKKYKCAACTPTSTCSGYDLDSKTGCSYGYDQCDNGCGTTKYKCAACTPTNTCSGYNLDSKTGCSHGYDQCDNGCGTKKYKCAACTPTNTCSGYKRDSSDACPNGADECDNGCGTKKYKCKKYKVGDDYFINGVQTGKVIAVDSGTVKIASQPQPSSQEIENYCTINWYVPNRDQAEKIVNVWWRSGFHSSDECIRMNDSSSSHYYCMCSTGMPWDEETCRYRNGLHNSCVQTVQQIEE